MQQPPPILQESRKLVRRAWMIIAGIMAFIVGGVLLLAGWLAYDDPPIDDSAMIPQWADKGGDSNPLAVFCLELESSKVHKDFEALPESVRKRAEGSRPQIQQFISKQTKAFAAFEKLMMSDSASWQWPGGPKISDANSKGEHISSVASFCKGLRLKSHLLCLEGRHEDAAKAALETCRFADGLARSQGRLLHILVAMTTEVLGQESLREALAGPSVSGALVQWCMDEIKAMEGLQRGEYQFALRAEYLWCRNVLQVVNDEVIAGLAQREGEEGREGALSSKIMSLAYKRNKSIAMRYGLDQPLVAALDQNWGEGFAAAEASDELTKEMLGRKKSPFFYLDSNITGKLLNHMMGVASLRMMERAIATAALREQTRAILALRLFELEHGRLPERLEELVPSLLKRVPEDPMTGHAMLWKSAPGVIYSVGADRKDDGGLVNDERPTKGADLGMRYPWSKQSPALNPK